MMYTYISSNHTRDSSRTVTFSRADRENRRAANHGSSVARAGRSLAHARTIALFAEKKRQVDEEDERPSAPRKARERKSRERERESGEQKEPSRSTAIRKLVARA